MQVVTIPGKLSRYEFISRGAVGWVTRINDRIVLKYAREANSEAFAQENTFYDLFEQQETPCPYILQSFLRMPDYNFLANMSGGSLDDRLRSCQVRAGPFGRVLEVKKTEPEERVALWFRELTSAVVWLESLGFVHGDLRPNNMLLDSRGHLKLGDFDCVEKFGDESYGSCAPWSRYLGDDAGSVGEPGARRGTFGRYGARTEQFAIGSNIYCMLYGLEPYGEEEDGPLVVQWMQDMQFPALQSRPLDAVIDKCWRNQYTQLRDLLGEAEALSPPEQEATLSKEYIQSCRRECQELVDGGLLINDEEKP
ncbi:protein kinase domain-containing protein [Ophiostoma piceae UAMH 11346]|uniref:EKC/KEOPS complex subunit BUD32 n=1 Tax=Ophiostoma piceae (strain UAMH 11346) TaxID=1262450 RepID=S3CX58_OPHP1|nr:protein kinase domain-containing protein [Ophiostoma piceae UAMH 11346]